jgi:DNA replication protein DnaC
MSVTPFCSDGMVREVVETVCATTVAQEDTFSTATEYCVALSVGVSVFPSCLAATSRTEAGGVRGKIVDLARCEFIERKENILALGNSGTGKTHIALAFGLAACQRGFRVRFTTAASLAHELIEAKDERRLMRFQKMLSSFELLIIDELGFVPLSKTGAELLFEVFSRRYERSATLVTSNLPFNEWTEAFGSERLTGALLDRLTHHVHILEMNGESYRLKDSKLKRSAKTRS